MTSESKLQPVYEVSFPQLEPGGVVEVRNKLRNYLQANAPSNTWNLDLLPQDRKIIIKSSYSPIITEETIRRGLEQSLNRAGFGYKYQIFQLPVSTREIAEQLQEAHGKISELERVNTEREGEIQGYKNREEGLNAGNTALQTRVGELSTEAQNLASQLRLTRKGYTELIQILTGDLRQAEQRIETLKQGIVPDEVMLEKYLFDPQAMTDFYLQIGRKKLVQLIPVFDSFKQERTRQILEKAVKQTGLNLRPEEYASALQEGSLRWEETPAYKRFKPEHDTAIEYLVFLNGLKVGTSGRDIPESIKTNLIRDLESRRGELDASIQRFQYAEQKYRQLSTMAKLVDELASQEKIEAPIVEQTVIYVSRVTPDGDLLYTPIDPELAETFLGSLLLAQLDKLGARFPYEDYLRYQVDPRDVLRTQHEYDFHRLGVKLSVVSLMEHPPSFISRGSTEKIEERIPKDDELLQNIYAEQQEKLLITLRIHKAEGREMTHAKELCEALELIEHPRLYRFLNPLLESGQVTRVGKPHSKKGGYRISGELKSA